MASDTHEVSVPYPEKKLWAHSFEHGQLRESNANMPAGWPTWLGPLVPRGYESHDQSAVPSHGLGCDLLAVCPPRSGWRPLQSTLRRVTRPMRRCLGLPVEWPAPADSRPIKKSISQAAITIPVPILGTKRLLTHHTRVRTFPGWPGRHQTKYGAPTIDVPLATGPHTLIEHVAFHNDPTILEDDRDTWEPSKQAAGGRVAPRWVVTLPAVVVPGSLGTCRSPARAALSSWISAACPRSSVEIQ
ncbi:hypothetical protein F4820DRAFT_471317 [Hypoxylon rubiginosum]|uniref:Uncharacterized protein n=1 Tax=Hypoxylon rubiginosum TaxID=110542 RepID=A0ACB9ZDR2_9PEZI|nr:hypothetical protein F4820DRAFT_471317 [Hypoxylon rubiginosum]